MQLLHKPKRESSYATESYLGRILPSPVQCCMRVLRSWSHKWHGNADTGGALSRCKPRLKGLFLHSRVESIVVHGLRIHSARLECMETDALRRPHSHTGLLEAIFIAEAGGMPMRRVPEVEAIVGRGLRGDRYAEGRGYYSKADPCEVTLIKAEVLDLIRERWGIEVHEGQHRRNLVVRGLRLRNMEGCRFRIGTVLLEYDRPRPPCGYMERLTQKGMTRALGEGAGIAARVIESGWIHENDPIEVFPGTGKRRRRLP
jgi:MOSC domain-containing protein YiiM